MELVLDQCSLVLVGSWNRAIFTPQWIAERLFHSEVKLEVAFGPALQVRHRCERADLILGPDRLQLRPLRPDDDAFAFVHESALRALRQLPETPMMALGMNYVFAVAPVHASLAELAARTRAHLVTDGKRAPLQLRTSTADTHGAEINLRLDVELERAQAEVNFHTNVQSASEAAAALERSPHDRLSPRAQALASAMLGDESSKERPT